ncbi:uncharacterized protein LOC136028628 [Artemia franciscana]
MNSFNIDEDTNKVILKYTNLDVRIETFIQTCYPRIHRESQGPISRVAQSFSMKGSSVCWRWLKYQRCNLQKEKQFEGFQRLYSKFLEDDGQNFNGKRLKSYPKIR